MTASRGDGSGAERTSPTVVVARRAAPGREREFERWLRRLVAAAQTAPGHVSSDVQAPTDAHPDEWVIVYQFEDAEQLRRWLDSDERAALMADGAHLVDGRAREQVLALAADRDPVTAVASFRVRPGAEHGYPEMYARLVGTMARFPGFLRSEMFPPVAGVQEETVIVFSFDGRDQLDAWLASPERAAFLAELDAHLDGGRTLNVVGGFGGWFAQSGSAPVTRWKQAAVVLLALFPTALALTKLREWLLPDVHWVVAVLFGNALGVVILTWALMPMLTARLDGWLRR